MPLRLVLCLLVGLSQACKKGEQAVVKDTPPEATVSAAPKIDATPAEANIIALNNAMFGVYDAALESFKKDFMSKHPVILALFSGAGGRFILYRPGQPPIEAPSPARLYQLVKSVGHTSIAIYSILNPYASDPNGQKAWVEPLKQFADGINKALSTVGELQIDAADRDVIRDMLTVEKTFAESVLAKGTFTKQELDTFCRGMKAWVKKIGAIAGRVQANHWVDTLVEWQKMLGADWDKVYAMSNTIYVTRQNNILFSILAQFMGTEAINRRLLLVETTSFTTTPEDMLGLMSRIMNDRELGQAFFNDKMLMDSELFGSAARDALTAAMKRVGREPVFPEYAHFNSNEWPWRTNQAFGDGPRTLEETPD